MSDALYISATGLRAQEEQINVIANNLSNVNTPGFKKSRVSFEDLMYKSTGATDLSVSAGGNKVGVGANVTSINKVFSVGDMKKTDRALDLGIRGDGFFEVSMPDGSYAYTRTGAFQVNNDGVLVNSDGYQVSPMIQIPPDAQDILIKSDGTVSVKIAGEDNPVDLGQLEIADFVNASGLNPVGSNLYLPTNESGDALYSSPGQNGAGLIAQGFLEASNVELVQELTDLMVAQRAYEINSKVIKAADEMMGIVNNLRG